MWQVAMMRNLRFLLLWIPLGLLAVPVNAAPVTGEKERPAGEMMGDAVTQPLSDANLKRREVPPALLAIRDNPYALDGIRTCRQLIAEVVKLDAVLGPDLDQIDIAPGARKRREGAANVAGGLISSLIPFRFLIREISGANRSDQEFRANIYAGVVRRGFLKGVGQQRRCRAPGRPFTRFESAQEAAATILEDKDDK